MLRRLVTVFALIGCAIGVGVAHAADVTVDPATLNLGYMNVFNLPPPDGDGTWVFGTGWGLGDLTAVYSGSDLTLGPNTVGDPNEFWYQCVDPVVPPDCGGPGAPGNKIMEANSYAQIDDGSLAGQTVTFSGIVLSNTLTSAHTVVAFVKDFAGDFSSFVGSTVPLPASGPFSVSLATINDPGRRVQWGFQMTGVNVWSTDVAPYGSVTIGPDTPTSVRTSSWGGLKIMYR